MLLSFFASFFRPGISHSKAETHGHIVACVEMEHCPAANTIPSLVFQQTSFLCSKVYIIFATLKPSVLEDSRGPVHRLQSGYELRETKFTGSRNYGKIFGKIWGSEYLNIFFENNSVKIIILKRSSMKALINFWHQAHKSDFTLV